MNELRRLALGRERGERNKEASSWQQVKHAKLRFQRIKRRRKKRRKNNDLENKEKLMAAGEARKA